MSDTPGARSPHRFHILVALTDRDLHGSGIVRDVLPQTGVSERRRYYRITAAGRSAVQAEAARLAAMARVAQSRLGGA